MIIVNSGGASTSGCTYLFVCALQNCTPLPSIGWRKEWGAFNDVNHFFKCSWAMTYLLCFKKLLHICYSLWNVWIMSFLMEYFSFRFHWTWWWGSILHPEVVLHKQISTFTIVQILWRIANPAHESPVC